MSATLLVSERLKSETASQHEAIESARRFSRLGSEDFNREEYKELLERFYGFYKPLEEIFMRDEALVRALDFSRRLKLPLLRQDLQFHGHTDETLAEVPVCHDLPTLDSSPKVLGSMYVMEGSTHGAQFISRRLRAHFNLDGQGVRFYEGYGKDTMPQWKAFKEVLDSTFTSEREADEIVRAATQTFQSLHRWMDA